MTLANDANTPTRITLVLRDENRVEVKKEFLVSTSAWDPATGLVADLKTIRDGLVTAYGNVSGALIYKAFITLAQTDDTAIAGPANSRISDAASVVVNLEDAPKQATIEIPAAVIGLFTGTTGKNRNKIDNQDAALLAFTELFSTTDGSFTISDGETITDTSAEQVDSGKRIVKKVKQPLS